MNDSTTYCESPKGVSEFKNSNSPTIMKQNSRSHDHEIKTHTEISLSLPVCRYGKFLKFFLKLSSLSAVIAFLALLVSLCSIHIFERYILPIIEVSDQYKVVADDTSDWENREGETYIDRRCGYEESSAKSTEEITWNNNTKQVYGTFSEMMMRHGAGLLPNILDPELSRELKQTIIRMNENEPEWKQFDIRDREHRWSLRINPYDTENDPNGVVRQAMKQIGSNPILVKALQELLGPDPAIVELSSITSEPGAAEQDFHFDIWDDASANRFARKYVQQYSLFMYLQDTYEDMGATTLCVGSHMCTTTDSEDIVCIPLETKAGSGILLSSSTMHQGSGNTAFHREDGIRVMFCVTFATRPMPRVDHRMLPIGSVYGIPWYVWGHTLSEMTTMTEHPWRIWHALGFRKNGKYYGWNYLLASVATNAENSYKGIDGDEFFLQPENYEKLLSLVLKLCSIVFGIYFFSLSLVFTYNTAARRKDSMHIFSLFKCFIFISLLTAGGLYLYSFSSFARGIASGKRFRQLPFQKLTQVDDDFINQITYPVKFDIMVGERLNAYYLFKNAYFYDYHLGNTRLLDLVRKSPMKFLQIPASTRKEYIQNNIINHLDPQTRFLEQNDLGYWIKMAEEQIYKFIWRELIHAAYPVTRIVSKEIDFILSQCKYGDGARKHSIFTDLSTDTIIVREYTANLMRDLKDKIYIANDRGEFFSRGLDVKKQNRQSHFSHNSIISFECCKNEVKSSYTEEKEEEKISPGSYQYIMEELQQKMLQFGVPQRLPNQNRKLVKAARDIIRYMEPYYQNVTHGMLENDVSRMNIKAFIKDRESCRNRNSNCLIWTLRGECEEFYDEMSSICAPTCRACYDP